jgi:transcriptional regulator with XRE-family HTH domain
MREIKEKSLFSKRLIKLRELHQLNQYELAAKLNLDRNKIAYLEAKASNPTADTLLMISDFFSVPIDYLLREDADKKTKPGPSSRFEKQLEEVKKLPLVKQNVICDMLNGIINQS